jgi:hypothetical protein
MSRTQHALAWALTADSCREQAAGQERRDQRVGAQTARQTGRTIAGNNYPALRRYAHDLTTLARAGRLARFAADANSHGIVVSDGIILNDNVLAMSVMVNGDNTAAMHT